MQMKCSKHPSNPPGDLLTAWMRSSHIAARWLHLDWIWFWAGGGANDNNAPTQHLLCSSTLFCAAWPINLYIATGCKKKKAFLHQMTSMNVLQQKWSANYHLVQQSCHFNGLFFMSPFTSFIHVCIISAHDVSKILMEVEKEASSSKLKGKNAKRECFLHFSPRFYSYPAMPIRLQWWVTADDANSSHRKSKNVNLQLSNRGNMWAQLDSPPSYNAPVYCVKLCRERKS